jgi:hypothetical protein
MDKNGDPVGMPASAGQNVPTFDQLYKQAFGKPPSGPKWEALLLTNSLGTQMQRLIVFPKGTPQEAVTTIRKAFQDVAKDPEFIAAFEKITREKPDVATAEEVEPLIHLMANVSPEIKKVLKESIAE